MSAKDTMKNKNTEKKLDVIHDERKDTLFYPALLTYDEGSEIAVEIPDLDVATSGINDEDALVSARELLGLTIFGLEEDGELIPPPTPLRKIHAETNQIVILVDVYMPAIRMAQNNKSVSRTVTLPAWLNAKALGYDFNFSQVLQDALKEKMPL